MYRRTRKNNLNTIGVFGYAVVLATTWFHHGEFGGQIEMRRIWAKRGLTGKVEKGQLYQARLDHRILRNFGSLATFFFFFFCVI